ncbi:MAG: CRISPR-associated protein Csx3 [Anaerolineae bacterium]|nr:CRISPR-associated protein Csx3 [Anaerolineae bacterium]
MNLLPAVVIGGPPHAGKSVLAYSLTRALRARDIPHYVLRAYPDGEGDWANESDQELVRAIRIKGFGSPEWIACINRDIDRRHLPLIVDVGGKPTAWQESVLAHCTHAIVLARDETSRAEWIARIERYGLILLADVYSDLNGQDELRERTPILRGTLAGLERGQVARGALFDALVERLATLFAYSSDELRTLHLARAPAELVLELHRLGKTLNALDDKGDWMPVALPRVLDYLPAGQSLALYDRAPNWLYAALALLARPAPLYQFDVRLGWVAPPTLTLGTPPDDSPVTTRLTLHTDYARLECQVRESYLDYNEAEGLVMPTVPSRTPLILSGKLPLWLWTALALTYADVPWLGVYQPQLNGAVIVHANESVKIGRVV